MVWVRLEERFDEDPDIVALSDQAFRLFVVGLCYCNRNRTDGVLREAIVKHVLKQNSSKSLSKTTKELEQAKLWVTTDDGWMVRNYLKYQPSRASLAAKVESGRAGGQASASARAQAKPQPRAQAGGEPPPQPVSRIPYTGTVKDAGAAVAAPVARAHEGQNGVHHSIAVLPARPTTAAAAESSDLPDEVTERLKRPPIGDSHA